MISNLSEIDSGELFQIDSQFLEKNWNQIDSRVESFLANHPIPAIDSTSPKISLSSLFDPSKSKIINLENDIFMYFHDYPDDTFIEIFLDVNNQRTNYITGLKILGMSLEAYVEAFYIVFEFPKKKASWHGLYDRDYTFLFTQDQMNYLGKGLGIKEIRKLSKPGLFIRKHNQSFSLLAYCLGPFGKLMMKSIQIRGNTITKNEDKVLLKGNNYLY